MLRYEANGEVFEFAPDRLQDFLAKYPNAMEVEKTKDVATQGAPVASETPAPASGESPLEDSSLESRETSWWKGEEGFIPDEWQGVKRPDVKVEQPETKTTVKSNFPEILTTTAFNKAAKTKDGLEKIASTYDSFLKDDGWDFNPTDLGVEVTAPNGKTETFNFQVESGFKVRDDGTIVSAGMISLPTSRKIHTQQHVRNFIDANQLSVEDSKALASKRFKIQKYINENIESEFDSVIAKEDLEGISSNAISPLRELEEQNPMMFDKIRNNIMEKYEQQFGTKEGLTDYQIEDVFQGVIDKKKNDQILASSDLLKNIHNDYKDGEYNYSWDEVVNFTTQTNVNKLPPAEQKLYKNLQVFKKGVISKINDFEERDDFDKNNPEYKKLLENKQKWLDVLQPQLEKIFGEGSKFYVDYDTGQQIDQDFDEDDDLLVVQDATEAVELHKNNILESIDGEDDKTFAENLKEAYEKDAVESSHFHSHNKQQTVDFKWHPGMGLNADSYIGFTQSMKRLGFDITSGKPIKNVPVNVILDNWGLFKNYTDDATQLDGEEEVNWNHLGQDIDWKDVGSYLKATKDLSIDMIARDRAWTQLHLLNVDPSSYKRDKSDLYWSGLVEALPWTDGVMQADAKERIAKGFREGALSDDQRINNFQKLVDETNTKFANEGVDPIKLTKKQIENFEMSRGENFAYSAGGFTPMVGEFALAGGLTNGALKVTKLGSYLNKLKTASYLTKNGKIVSGANVAKRAAKVNKTPTQYVDDLNKSLRGRTGNKKDFVLKLNKGKTWQKGIHTAAYALIEEGKMWSLDPLFGTDMPAGSGIGFYLGGAGARALMPWKIGSQTNKMWQRVGRMVNPLNEKVVKAGIGGAVAAEVALPVEQTLFGHKSWQRWVEETYPDMSTVEKRFTGNLALFGAFGFTHMKKTDAAFMVGAGKHYRNKWARNAAEFNAISKKGGEVNGKKYTAEEARAEQMKYLELAGHADQYVNISEKAPEFQNPVEQKKMVDAQLENLVKDGAKFRYYVTTGGKNHAGKKADAYWQKGKDGVSEIYINANKVQNGQIPHEVWHHITMDYLAKGKTNEQLGFELAEFSARIQDYIQKAVGEGTKGDLDFMKFIEKAYGKDMPFGLDLQGEIPANLIELMMSKHGYDMFVSNNLITDIAFEYQKLAEKMFTGADGKVRGGWAGKWLQPKLDLSNPKTVVDYLARLSSGIEGGKYNPNVINRLKEMFDGMEITKDGKLIKNEKDGSQTVVSTNSKNINEQLRLKEALKPIIEEYKSNLNDLNGRREKGEVSMSEYESLRQQYNKEFVEKKEALGGKLISIRDTEDKDLRANKIKEKDTKLGDWKDQIDAAYTGTHKTKAEFQGSREADSIAKALTESTGLKNSIAQAKTLLGVVEDVKGQFYEDVMFEIQKRYSKNYNPGKINPEYNRALTPWEWLTTGHRSGTSNLYRAIGDAVLKHKTKVPTVKVDAAEGGWGAFEGYTVSDGYMKSSKPFDSKADQKGLVLSKTLEGMNKQVDGKRLGKIIDQKSGADAKNLDFTAKGAKDIVSYKNIKKNAEKTIGKEVVVDYYGTKAEMFEKMKKSDSQWLNNEDIRSIVETIKGDIANELAVIPFWKQVIIDPISGENVAFDIVAGKFKSEPKATGTTTKLLKLGQEGGLKDGKIKGLLFNEIPQTGTKGSKYEWSDRFKEYQKTIDLEFKRLFEEDVVRSLTEGKDKSEISGILKGWMTQMQKALYVQGVNKALPNIPELTTRHSLAEMINQISAGKNPGLASKAIWKELSKDIQNSLKSNKAASMSDLIVLVNSERYKSKFNEKDITKVSEELAKLNKIQKQFEHGVQKDLSKQEELAVRETQIDSKMEVLEANNYKDLVNKTKKQFSKDPDIKKINAEEGLENWSDPSKNPNAAKDVAIQNVFDGAVLNKYNKKSVLADAKTAIMSTMYQGKVKRYNEATGKMERMNLPSKNKTAEGYFDFHMDVKWKGTDADMAFLKDLKIVDTGKFKTDMAKFIEANKNAENLVELVWEEGRRLLTKKGSTYKATVEAGKKARQFHLDAMREVVVNHKDYGLTRAQALQGFFRHLRAQTNITNGMIKGTATITSATKMLGEPVGKDVNAKNYLGTMYHAEHQLQLLNFSMNAISALVKSGKNTAKWKKLSGELNDLFEQTIQTKQDQLIYDYGDGNTPTTFLKSFKGKNLGEVMSILNVMHRPGVAFETVDFKANKPMTVGESIINNYTKKQIDVLLKEAARTGELNSLSYELKLANENRGANNKNKKKLKNLGFGEVASKDIAKAIKTVDKALELGRKLKKKSRGMSTFDFDETLIIEGKNFVTASKGGKVVKIPSDKWPIDGPRYAKEGYKFDFSDFVNVRGGKEGPLLQKMKNQIKKYGPDNVFVLTARMQEAAGPIHAWLKANGVKIPIENITGLGKSEGEAKAMWMLEKFAEGYNDMYFVDDALPNVKAVKRVLEQLDIKSNVQQALASKNISQEVNNIMEHSLDIKSEKRFSKAEGKVRGKDIKRRRFFFSDSAADLELLIEPLYGKGKKGIENKEWFKKEFVQPFERGIRDYNTAKQSTKSDYMALRKQNKDVVKQLPEQVEGTNFTNDMAIRVYLWNKAGHTIPDLAPTTQKKLVKHVVNNPKLQAYAEQFAKLTKVEGGLKEPTGEWWAETLAGEIINMERGVSRKQYLQDWIDRKNEIFSEENLNKMESKLGTRWRENVKDMFDRMETGRTRGLKMDRGSAAMMNYLNGSVGTIMNFNTRSAALQTISTLNFLNMRENNPIAAARAMGDVKQFSKDFMYIMNSDMLKQRRDGLEINVTEAELASAAAESKNPIRAITAKILKAGYLPTKLADSFAISFGGATFYRNRIKMYEKQGLSSKEAEAKAWIDFQSLSERTQQSSRPDLLSKQQTSFAGRLILPFANTPMQMNRRGAKDILDLAKGRYKNKAEAAEKMGRITYYMGAQVALFAGLQSALFGMLLNDEDVSNEKIEKTKTFTLNTISDSFLRGLGIQGAVLSGLKNAVAAFHKQEDKGFTADYSEVGEALLNISPPIGSKFGKLDAAGDKRKWAKIKDEDEFKFELGNPSLEASLLTIEALSNLPVHRVHKKTNNIMHSLNSDYENWQRVHMIMGWTPWNVGVESDSEKKKKKKKVIEPIDYSIYK